MVEPGFRYWERRGNLKGPGLRLDRVGKETDTKSWYD